MAISVAVALLSGRVADINVEPGSSMDELKRKAQLKLRARGRLLTSTGASLDGSTTVPCSTSEAPLRL